MQKRYKIVSKKTMPLSFKIISLCDFKEDFGDKCGSLNLYWLLFSGMPNVLRIEDRVLVFMLHKYSDNYIKNNPDSHYFLDPSLLKNFQRQELRTSSTSICSLHTIPNECVSLLDCFGANRRDEQFLVLLKGNSKTRNHAFSIGVTHTNGKPIYTLNEVYNEPPFFIQKTFPYLSNFRAELSRIYTYKQKELDKYYSHIQYLKLETF